MTSTIPASSFLRPPFYGFGPCVVCFPEPHIVPPASPLDENLIPQAKLGGASPFDLVYDSGLVVPETPLSDFVPPGDPLVPGTRDDTDRPPCDLVSDPDSDSQDDDSDDAPYARQLFCS